jgi:hypothetical protein
MHPHLGRHSKIPDQQLPEVHRPLKQRRCSTQPQR